MFGKVKRFLLGDPLASHLEKHERLTIPVALAVFASDALSSTAYASEEILIAFMGTQYHLFSNLLSLPVALAIGLLMATVVLSYRQVIRAYPEGGGTYEVSKEKLGLRASQVAGAALLIDYVLTVAVSISAGVAAITSTGLVPPQYKVVTALMVVFVIMLMNLRGVRESGKTFAIPSYIFIFSMAALIVTGLWRVMMGDVPPVTQTVEALQASGGGGDGLISLALLLVLLKAFSHGCAALTGIEAISDGVKAFKEPSEVNANKTLVLMGSILGAMFLGVTYLAFSFQIMPDPHGHETVVSMIARNVFGGGTFFYYLVQVSTMVILFLAANTSFSGFPRLATILAGDGFLPRQLMTLGDRLVFSNGIIILGLLSILLIILYHADTHALIPLYAVGVFLSFTLAQAGMVFFHRDNKGENWQSARLINGFGAAVTGVVTIILTLEKFTEGAWIVIVAIPILIFVFEQIRSHYESIGKQLALPDSGYCPRPVEHTVLVLVSSLNKGTIPALEYAKTISERVEAVHVELKPEATARLRRAWDEWGCGIPLTILKSPYRSLMEPLLEYIDEVETRYEHDLVTVIVPEFVTKKSWHNLLHNQTSILLKAILRSRKGKVVTTVRYHLEE